MPTATVVFYGDGQGSAPVLEWLGAVPPRVRDKYIVRVERLAACGSALRRPEADYLRDGIYELRVRHLRVNYRILYFLHGRHAVLCHGLTKSDEVPDVEIQRALTRQAAFVADPQRHTYAE